jgi:hypothetical protein
VVNPLFILYFFVTASETGRFVCQFQHSSVLHFQLNITKIRKRFYIS